MKCIFECRAGFHVIAIVESDVRTTRLNRSCTYSVFNCDVLAWEEMKRNGYCMRAVNQNPCYGRQAVREKRSIKITWRDTSVQRQKTLVSQLIQFASDMAMSQWSIDQNSLDRKLHPLNLTDGMFPVPKPHLRASGCVEIDQHTSQDTGKGSFMEIGQFSSDKVSL